MRVCSLDLSHTLPEYDRSHKIEDIAFDIQRILTKLLDLSHSVPQTLVQLFFVDIILSLTPTNSLLSELSDPRTSDLLLMGIIVFISTHFYSAFVIFFPE